MADDVFRYLAFVVDPLETDKLELARSLMAAADAVTEMTSINLGPGVTVLYSDVRTEPATGIFCKSFSVVSECGVVLGTLFAKSRSQPFFASVTGFSAEEGTRILRTRGKHLVENYWGRYVAIACDTEQRAAWVLRDPTGAMPCYTTVYQGITIIFSWLPDVLALGIDLHEVNWEYIAARVCVAWRLEARETGLRRVASVFAGERMEWKPSVTGWEQVWDPAVYANLAPLEEPDIAAAALRETTRSVVRSWASQFRGILVLLSGGLDSSILLSCLRETSPKTTVGCLNYYLPAAGHDERPFARAAASFCGAQLFERERASRIHLPHVLSATPSPSPTLYIQWLENGATEAEIAAQIGAPAVFGGHYGDQIFQQGGMRYAVADFIRMHKFRRQLLCIALVGAYTEYDSVWSLLLNGMKLALTHTSSNPRLEGFQFRRLVRREILEQMARSGRFSHPWRQSCVRVAPGKFRQIHFLSDPIELYNPFRKDGDPDHLYPLLSQPLLELCLRIPTHTLTLNGRDRGLARSAFRHDLPREIIGRVTKGQMEDQYHAVVRENLAFLREMLLGGRLVTQGLLDRQKIESALSGELNSTRAGFVELFDHLSIEAWLRNVSISAIRTRA